MKKIIVFSAMVWGSMTLTSTLKAQTFANTNLHIVITDALSITVNQPDVTLSFLTAADYQNGVSTLETGHLTVTSNQPYDLNVKTAASILTGAVTGNSIAANTVTVEVDNPVAQALGGTPTPVNGLSTTDQPILIGGTAATQKNIDILYSIPAAISQTPAILGKPADTYTTVVTYTISQ